MNENNENSFESSRSSDELQKANEKIKELNETLQATNEIITYNQPQYFRAALITELKLMNNTLEMIPKKLSSLNQQIYELNKVLAVNKGVKVADE